MKFSQLIAKRTLHLMKDRHWKPYKLSMQSGIPHSTLCTILKAKCKSMTSENLLNICRGLNVPLKDFFDDPMFEFENISDD